MTNHEPTSSLDQRFSSDGATTTSWNATLPELADAEIFWISTVRPDGRPHVTPLISVLIDDSLFFCTGATEQKAKNVEQNPNVVMTTGNNSLNNGLDQVEGEAVLVTDEPTLQLAADLYASKYEGWHLDVRDGASHGDGGAALLFQVKVDKAFGWQGRPLPPDPLDVLTPVHHLGVESPIRPSGCPESPDSGTVDTEIREGTYCRAMPDPRVERPQMPDYGVDAVEWEGLPWQWATERLTSNRNFWVVTASRDGRPHALPVWGVWDDGDHQFAFSCGPRSRKAANLADNPNMAFMIDNTVECVSVEGTANAIEGERADIWIDRYLAKYASEAPDLSAEFLRANRIFEVRPTRAFGIIEREDAFAQRATRWRFADELSPPAVAPGAGGLSGAPAQSVAP